MVKRKEYFHISSRTIFKDILKLFKHKKYLTKDKKQLVIFYSKLTLKEKDIIDSITGCPNEVIIIDKK